MPVIFDYHHHVTGEGQDYGRDGHCRIYGHCADENPTSATIDIEVQDAQGHLVHLRYLFEKEGDDLVMKFPTVGEPLVDYSLCVARKVAAPVAGAAFDCYRTTKGWREFLQCMKNKAPALGIRAILALFTCVGAIAGLE